MSRGSRRHGSCYGEVTRMFWGFQTIATCRDGLKNSRDKSATSLFASGKRGNRRVRDKTRESATWRTNQRGRHGFVADLSRRSRRSRHSGIWALASIRAQLLPTYKYASVIRHPRQGLVGRACYGPACGPRAEMQKKDSGQNTGGVLSNDIM